jgi:dTDP-4-dehydrorhamnose 3,5-epimerase
VVVDLRMGSPTFGRSVSVELTEKNKRQLWIPEGLAHGFVVLSEAADFLYKATDYYHPASERCLLWSDPALAIAWPAAPPGGFTVSDKDRQGECFDRNKAYFP